MFHVEQSDAGTSVLEDAHDAGNPRNNTLKPPPLRPVRRRDTRHRRPLLPFHRGQDSALQGRPVPPRHAGARRLRRNRNLSKRTQLLAPARRAGTHGALHSGTGKRRVSRIRLRDRIRRHRPARTETHAGIKARRRPLLRRTDKPHNGLRGGCSAGFRRRCQRRFEDNL